MSAPKIIVEKHEGYRTIIESGVFGGHRPGFFEWIMYSDEMVADEALATIPPDASKSHIKRTLQFRVVAAPIDAKNFAQWLNGHIAEYEKNFGEITLEKKPAKPQKGPQPYI